MNIRGNFCRTNISRLQTVKTCRSCEKQMRWTYEGTRCPDCSGNLTTGIQTGDVITGNFMQSVPHTDVSTHFGSAEVEVRGNGMNCDFPATVSHTQGLGSSHAVHKSICSHLHPNRLAAGDITECADNCTHVTNTDTVTIDGELLGTFYTYEDKVV